MECCIYDPFCFTIWAALITVKHRVDFVSAAPQTVQGAALDFEFNTYDTTRKFNTTGCFLAGGPIQTPIAL